MDKLFKKVWKNKYILKEIFKHVKLIGLNSIEREFQSLESLIKFKSSFKYYDYISNIKLSIKYKDSIQFLTNELYLLFTLESFENILPECCKSFKIDLNLLNYNGEETNYNNYISNERIIQFPKISNNIENLSITVNDLFLKFKNNQYQFEGYTNSDFINTVVISNYTRKNTEAIKFISNFMNGRDDSYKLPKSLTSLSVSSNSNYSFKPIQGYMSNIKHLNLGGNFNNELTFKNFNNLESIEFPIVYRKPTTATLFPPSLKKISYSLNYPYSLVPGCLPKNLKELEFKGYYHQKIKPNTIPISLEHFSCGIIIVWLSSTPNKLPFSDFYYNQNLFPLG